jgi:hypothetical protein
MTCPVNTTQLAAMLNRGRVQDSDVASLHLPASLLQNDSAAVFNASADTTPSSLAAAAARDSNYYAACAQELPVPWPDFNGIACNNR